jgi:hypothetical protein
MSNALCWAQGLTSDAVAEILATLTRSETKVASAEKLLDDAMKLYAIPAEDKWSIIDGLINPQERRLTESMLRKYEFRNPGTTWAGTGYSLIMEDLFADDGAGGALYVLPVPATWSLDLWASESDISFTGRSYSHWVRATLPSFTEWDLPTPITYALVSDRVHGTLNWGGYKLNLYRGEITVREDRHANILGEVLFEELQITH